MQALPDDLSNDSNSNGQTFYTCVRPGLYDFSVLTTLDLDLDTDNNNDNNDVNDNDNIISCTESCYQVYVNQELVITGPTQVTNFRHHSLFINMDGLGRPYRCENRPYISPINEHSKFTFDDRVAKTLSVIQALSDTADIFAKGSGQYKASCYILYDDPLRMNPESNLFAERYAIALLMYSTKEMAEVELMKHHCDNPQLECDEEGFIIGINLGTLQNICIFLYIIFNSIQIKIQLNSNKNSTPFNSCIAAGGSLQGRIPTEISHFTKLGTVRLDSTRLSLI